jgi:hypothetical protein
VVKTTCFVADAGAFQKLNELYAEHFPSAPPVRSTPIVALPRGLLISIEAVAVVGAGRRRAKAASAGARRGGSGGRAGRASSGRAGPRRAAR